MKKTHNYNTYQEYVDYQLIKTSDKDKQKKWLGDEWDKKINIFYKLFKKNKLLIKDKKNAICLGSRTGQEVVALKKIGINNCIGIDLHEFKPYTIKGDIHNIKFSDNHFDLAFTNIFDHSLYPEKFVSEIYRILDKDGIFILHLQLDIKQDKYTEVIVKDINILKKLFIDNNFEIISEGNINSGCIAMNYEIVFKK